MSSSQFFKGLFASILTLVSSVAGAASYYVDQVAINAANLGQAGAGSSAVTNSAAVLTTNPALMTIFLKPQWAVEGRWKFYNDRREITNLTDPDKNFSDSNCCYAGFFPASIFYVAPAHQRVSFGLGLDTSHEIAVDNYKNKAKGNIKLWSLGLAGAFRITPGISIGAGFNLAFLQSLLSREQKNFAQSAIVPNWNLGLVYEIDNRNRFGFAYHSKINIRHQDNSLFGKPVSLMTSFPDYFDFSAYHRIGNFAIAYSYKLSLWESTKLLEAKSSDDGSIIGGTIKFRNGSRFSLGLSYDLGPVTMRTGMAYDQGNREIGRDSKGRTWFSAGLSYRMGNSTISLGYAYVLPRQFKYQQDDQQIEIKEQDHWIGLSINMSF